MNGNIYLLFVSYLFVIILFIFTSSSSDEYLLNDSSLRWKPFYSNYLIIHSLNCFVKRCCHWSHSTLNTLFWEVNQISSDQTLKAIRCEQLLRLYPLFLVLHLSDRILDSQSFCHFRRLRIWSYSDCTETSHLW